MNDKSVVKPAANENNWIEISDPSRLSAKPVVSVLMPTYNHGPYLAEAIEGVLMQKTGFPVELLIGEDCSSDNTRDVAIRYQREYPHLIRIITSQLNVGAFENFKRLLAATKGVFVAFCEGDDYWIDSNKLSDQVSLIRGNPSISVVHADHVIRYDFWGKKFILSPDGRYAHNKETALEGDLSKNAFGNNHGFAHIAGTCTVLYYTENLRDYFTEWANITGMGYDISLASYIFTKGSVAYLSHPMSAYRITPGSMLRSGAKMNQKMAMEIREFFVKFNEKYGLYNDRYLDIYKDFTIKVFIASFEMNDCANFLKSEKELKSLGLNTYERRLVFTYSLLFAIPILRTLFTNVKNIVRYCRSIKEKIVIFMGFRKRIVLN